MLKPLNNQVLIAPDNKPAKPETAGLILAVSTHTREPVSFVEVLDCGPDVTEVTCGQTVLCNADAIMEVNGAFVVPEDQIFAVVE